MPSTPHLDHPRADIAFIDGDDNRRYPDVTVVSATSRQALQGGSGNKIGVSAKQGEQAKINKYKPIDVKPLVLESGGRVGQLVGSLLPSGAIRSSVAQVLWQTISVALQRANARALLPAKRAWRRGG